MPEQVHTRALTIKQRIKARLSITVASHDDLLDRLVSAVTDFLEQECSRTFKETTYLNEVYSIHSQRQNYLLLKQAPVSALSSFQYRAGTVSNPSWTNFNADDYELLENGASGIVKIYGGFKAGVNDLRATYTAGYKIDFDNAGDTAKHTLPFDLSDLAERLVVKFFKKREHEGKDSETFEGNVVSWAPKIDELDQSIINKYRRLPTFV